MHRTSASGFWLFVVVFSIFKHIPVWFCHCASIWSPIFSHKLFFLGPDFVIAPQFFSLQFSVTNCSWGQILSMHLSYFFSNFHTQTVLLGIKFCHCRCKSEPPNHTHSDYRVTPHALIPINRSDTTCKLFCVEAVLHCCRKGLRGAIWTQACFLAYGRTEPSSAEPRALWTFQTSAVSTARFVFAHVSPRSSSRRQYWHARISSQELAWDHPCQLAWWILVCGYTLQAGEFIQPECNYGSCSFLGCPFCPLSWSCHESGARLTSL